MDSIKINTGEIRLCINDDETRVIVFNPTDILFVEKYYALVRDLEVKQAEYLRRSAQIEKVTGVNDDGLPVNMDERIAILREACEYMRGRIDYLFGDGTSQKAFGDAMILEAFEQFFNGVTPYVQKSRSEKMERYTGRKKHKAAVLK